jgi:hypothetical protein
MQNPISKVISLLHFTFFLDNGRKRLIQLFTSSLIDKLRESIKNSSGPRILFKTKFFLKIIGPFFRKQLRDKRLRIQTANLIFDAIDLVLSDYGVTDLPSRDHCESLGLLFFYDFLSLLFAYSYDLFSADDFRTFQRRAFSKFIIFPPK